MKMTRPNLVFMTFWLFMSLVLDNSSNAFSWSPTTLKSAVSNPHRSSGLPSRMGLKHSSNEFGKVSFRGEETKLNVVDPSSSSTVVLGEAVVVEDVLSSPFVIAGIAIVLGVAAQSFINQMLEGDQGLGAFLKDGSGYNKSGFRNVNDKKTKNKSNDDDPLPWLKLPKLDFVEVAGQEKDDNIYNNIEELERLRQDMNKKLAEGNLEEATIIREKLETAMEQAGIEYKPDN